MEKAQVDELVYQALETEMGGVKIYRTAIEEKKDVKTAIVAARAKAARKPGKKK